MAKLERGINDLFSYCKQNNRDDLLEEWDYKKNESLRPEDVCYGSAKKVWWIGKCGHSFLSSLNRRTANNTGCPYCCDSHAKLLPGFNDLETTNPEILPSWDYEKNGQLKPSMVMKGQHISVWWKGACGHSWKSTVYHRVGGRGCPECRKESKTSFQEQALYYYVKRAFPDAESGNTTLLRGKEIDIYVPSINIGIEFDGSPWHSDKEKDEMKDQLCASIGLTLYRIRDIKCPVLVSNPHVHVIDFESYTDESLEKVLLQLERELNVDFKISLEVDSAEIYGQYISQKKEKSLSKEYPALAKEWSKRNSNLTPDMVSAGSNKKVWWICSKGHEWKAVVASRVKLGAGCPYCNGNRILKGFNDLETLQPDLLKYWSYDKNIATPQDVTSHSNQKVWWHCPRCENDFLCSVNNKVKHPSSCPYCSHRIVQKGVSDLRSNNPILAEEWDYSKNGDMTPDTVTASSALKVWWICKKGHSFEATISNRKSGKGCPICSGRKVLKGFNDFASKHSELLHEWNYERNHVHPDEVTEHSGRKIWWICKAGHEWQATIASRSKGIGCPYCKGCHKKAVRNIDKNEVFVSLTDAAKSCGLKNGDTISLCCQGKQKTAGGFHWEYIERRI